MSFVRAGAHVDDVCASTACTTEIEAGDWYWHAATGSRFCVPCGQALRDRIAAAAREGGKRT